MSPPPDIRIRPATAADVPALGRLGAELVAVHHAFDARRFIPSGPEMAGTYGDFLAGEMQRPDAVVLVAEEVPAEGAGAGAVLGYAYGALEGEEWLTLRGPAGAIHDLLVDPARRGGGVGRRLLEAMVAALRDLGAPQVVLSTAQHNTGAQKLFAAAGFRPTLIEMTRDFPEDAPPEG